MPTNFIFLAIEFLLVKLYVNSYLALLNARYYTRVNADTNSSYLSHSHHEVYRPVLHIRPLEDEELQASRKGVSKHLDNETVNPSRLVKQPNAVTAEITKMNDFLSV
ncbi:hypothetical protein BDR07DRAFT_735389 [Suillus spraguei]|nr:hypothetical protein BDR07DRAFT_735389 [Suillus spraguei]